LAPVFVVMFAIIAAAGASAETRVALVVGIADYEKLPDLKNTVSDGRLLQTTLAELDFKVTSLMNPGLETLREKITQFQFQAETADVALVYFAGHGMEVGGRNFLIPADSPAQSREGVAEASISLDDILAAVDRARQLRIVILDSCRNDPFQPDGQTEIVTFSTRNHPTVGLAPPSPERGTLVAFAAEDGKVAVDGVGNNSPFALALSRNLGTPNLEIGLMFRQVRDDVLRATANFQEPHTYGSLSGQPYFLAGQSQSTNRFKDNERKSAWARLDLDQEQQLAKLAENGDPRALKGLAYMRLDPNEARFDPARARTLLEAAAAQGDPEAKFELGRLYEKGLGVEQDIEKAIGLFQQSADAGFSDALNDLGFLHFQGALGVVRNPDIAARYFERAAALRHPEAMFNFAALIDDGMIEEKTTRDAAELLYDALRGGNEDVLRVLTEDPLMFKSQTRSALQQLLTDRGFYHGAIDGRFGPQTQRGLRRAYGLAE
jgi:TPR repeat protein